MAKTTMRDVAKHAQISVATVSHVINDTRFVSEETRARVMNSIKELDFRPNAMARILKTGQKNLIGFIVPDIANDFFATLIEEIESVISTANYKLIIVNTKETIAQEIEGIKTLANGIVDGLVVASTCEQYTEWSHYIPEELPVVLIDRCLPGAPYDSIAISDYDALYQGMEILARGGHRRIGYIAGLSRLSTTHERLSAYRDALTSFQLPVDDDLIRFGDSMSKSAIVHVAELLKLECTALVVSNNIMTRDVLSYLHENNIRIGVDFDIVGYQDSMQNDFFLRKIHLVKQPVVQLGRNAGQQILERIHSPDIPVKEKVLQSNFFARGNT